MGDDNQGCIDESKMLYCFSCTEEYQPVLDGLTYNNDCKAERGVNSDGDLNVNESKFDRIHFYRYKLKVFIN